LAAYKNLVKGGWRDGSPVGRAIRASPQPYSVPSSLCVKPQNSRTNCQSLLTVLPFQSAAWIACFTNILACPQASITARSDFLMPALAVETNLSLYEIAFRTGFSSPSTLARACRMKFGETLRQKKVKAIST